MKYRSKSLNHLRVDEVYDANQNTIIEDPATSGDDWRIERVYVNGPGQLGQIVKQIVYTYASDMTGTPQSEDEYFLGYDVLGNVSVISNAAGNEVDQFEQDAFGNQVESSWASPAGGITEHLTTKQYDDFLGLYYFNARWYDPQVGAFVSRDTNFNELDYTTANANPVLYLDPTGLKTCIYLCTDTVYGSGSAPIGGHASYHQVDSPGNWRSSELSQTKATTKTGHLQTSFGFGGTGIHIRRFQSSNNWHPRNASWVDKWWDLTDQCNPRCLKGNWSRTFKNPSFVSPTPSDGGEQAYLQWTLLPNYHSFTTISAGRVIFGPVTSIGTWGTKYHLDHHNSNHYMNELLSICCPASRLRVHPVWGTLMAR